MKTSASLVLATVLVFSGCASDSEEGPPKDSPPEVVSLRGFLSAGYVGKKGKCDEIKFPAGGVVGMFRRELSLTEIKKVEGATVVIRDAEGAELATATTPPSARLIFQGTHAGGGDDYCLALGKYSAQVPHRDSYIFSVEGVPGAPPPVSIEDLEELEYQCDLFIERDKGLDDKKGCYDVGPDVAG